MNNSMKSTLVETFGMKKKIFTKRNRFMTKLENF